MDSYLFESRWQVFKSWIDRNESVRRSSSSLNALSRSAGVRSDLARLGNLSLTAPSSSDRFGIAKDRDVVER